MPSLSGNKLKSAGVLLLCFPMREKETVEDFGREQERKTSLKVMSIL